MREDRCRAQPNVEMWALPRHTPCHPRFTARPRRLRAPEHTLGCSPSIQGRRVGEPGCGRPMRQTDGVG
jgi:hypothetical protein